MPLSLPRLSILAALIMLVSSLQAQPKYVDGIVAVLGRNIVLKSDVDQQYKSQARQAPEGQSVSKCEVFENLLLEKLLLHQAKIDSVTVSEDEVEMNIDRRINVFIQQIGSRQKLEQYYDKSIVEIKEEMTPLIRDQMVAQRMMQEIHSDIEITPSEVRSYYNDIPEDSLPLINAEVEYSEIVRYPEPTEEARQEAIDRLEKLKERIEEGSSFNTMAVLYSEDPGSAKKGGEYKGIQRGQFVKEFEAVAFNLEVGEISDPFRTEYGYHIVQLQMKRGQELDLRHILIKPKISPEQLSKAEDFLDSLRTVIRKDTITFAQAARRYSKAEDSRLNGGKVVNPQTGDLRWETGQLPKNIFYALEELEQDSISEPVFFRNEEDREGYRLVKLINRTKAHVANLTSDYQRIKEAALNQKKQEALQDWVEDKLNSTYVRVNNENLNCEFQRSWVEKSTRYVE